MRTTEKTPKEIKIDAELRVILKRKLRKAKVDFDNNWETERLQAHLENWERNEE